MSGETEKELSGWTVDTLRYFITGVLHEKDLRYEQRFTAQELAISKAAAADEKRFEGVNEFRAQLADQASTFMPRAEAMLSYSTLNEKLNLLASRIDHKDGDSTGKNSQITRIITIVSVLMAITAVVISIL